MDIKIGDVIGKIEVLGEDTERTEEMTKKGQHRKYYFVKCIKCGATTDKQGNRISMRLDNILTNKATNKCRCKKTQVCS